MAVVSTLMVEVVARVLKVFEHELGAVGKVGRHRKKPCRGRLSQKGVVEDGVGLHEVANGNRGQAKGFE